MVSILVQKKVVVLNVQIAYIVRISKTVIIHLKLRKESNVFCRTIVSKSKIASYVEVYELFYTP